MKILRYWSIAFAALTASASISAQQAISPSITVNTCGAGSPVVIASGGSNPSVQIGNSPLSGGLCPSLFKNEPKAPKASKRRVLIASAWLEPVSHFFLTSHGDYPNTLSEVARVYLKIVNITSSPILVTGAAADYKKARRVESSAGGWGESTLSASHGRSARILLQPGEEREISLDRAVKLRGLAAVLPGFDWMTSANIFENPSGASYGQIKRLADLRMLPAFNQILSDLYGSESMIGITIFEGDFVPLAKVEIPLAKGVDYFYRAHGSGAQDSENPIRFDHSMFLASAMLDFRRNGYGRGPAPVEPKSAGD